MSQSNLPVWDLGLLYTPGAEEQLKAAEELLRRRTEFAEYRRLLEESVPSEEQFREMVVKQEEMWILASRLEGLAAMWFSEDTSQQKAQSFLAQMAQMTADLSNDLIFFDLWWQKLDQETASRLRKSLPEFDYFLIRLRALAEHTLSEPEEKIITVKNTSGREALITLYDFMTSSYRFDTAFDPEGGGRQVSREELSVYFRSHNPDIRAGAYGELYRVYGQAGPLLGQIYQALVRDYWQENVRLRRYPSPQNVRHKANDLPQAAVDCLLSVCRRKAPEVFGRYFRKKALALGTPKLRRCDLYAPLAEDTRTWSFDEAMAIVEKCFGGFDPRLAELARAVPQARHLDAAVRPGKRDGAYCNSVAPMDIPWVFMSYKGRTHDVFTLAHELGHAVHSQLARDNNFFQFSSSLPLAETASTFGEMLLAKYLRDEAQTPAQREAVSFQLLDDAYATVGRQAFFALFEIQAHDLVQAGATADELAQAYWENLESQFREVELGPEFRWEWVSIPHIFHAPFYVYAYSFGQLLVYSLWRIYEREGPVLAQRLIKLLSRGGSASPADLLAEAELGPLNEEFWLGGFEVIESFLE